MKPRWVDFKVHSGLVVAMDSRGRLGEFEPATLPPAKDGLRMYPDPPPIEPGADPPPHERKARRLPRKAR